MRTERTEKNQSFVWLSLLRVTLIAIMLTLLAVVFLSTPERMLALGNQYAVDGVCDVCHEDFSLFRYAVGFLLIGSGIFLGATFLFRSVFAHFQSRVQKEIRWIFARYRVLNIKVLLRRHWLIFPITLVGLLLRLRALGDPLRYDEAYTYLTYLTRPLTVALSLYDAPNNHLFSTFLEYVSVQVFGNSELAIRLPAFVAGILFIPLCYGIFSRISRAVAALSSVLISCWPFFIFYATSGRGYQVGMFLVMVIFLLCWEYYEHPRLIWLLPLPAFIAAVLFTVPTFLYFVAAIFLMLFVHAFRTLLRSPFRGRILVWQLSLTMAIAGMLTVLLYLPVLLVSASYIVQNFGSLPFDWTLLEGVFHLGQSSLLMLGGNNTIVGIGLLILGLLGLLSSRIPSERFLRNFVCFAVAILPAFFLWQRRLPFDRNLGYLLPFWFALGAVAVCTTGKFLMESINSAKLRAWSFQSGVLGILILLVVLSAHIIVKEIPTSDPLGRCLGCPIAIEFMRSNDSISYVDLPADVPLQYYALRNSITLS
ncbi:MAG TPA: glycosyltransferase family 39 protein, partial [Candidatus Nanoarchaeia archaeon]|nr:glycosyltransferase family 39 protein [Candidatus Nanoarchaeia archaeon]